PPGGDSLVRPCESLLALALHRQRPPTQARAQGHPEWKALRGRECHSYLCLLEHSRYIPSHLRDDGRASPRICQTKRMRELMGKRQGMVHVYQGLIWIPQQPAGIGGIGSARNSRILAQARQRSIALV